MNAVFTILDAMERPALGRLLAGICRGRPAALGDDEIRRRLRHRFATDLVALLNLMVRAELNTVAEQCGIERTGSIGEVRARLWMWAAAAEAGGEHYLGTAVQPVPVLLRGKLVHMGAEAGLAPPAEIYPRQIPDERVAESPNVEPDTLEDLLELADQLVGVRLGSPRRDKGAFGNRIAALLGVVEDGHAEPDWRGEIEIKTVPVVRDVAGWWRVKEDPAVSMEGVSPLSKLRRVLWIARVADAGDSPVLSWFFQEWDESVDRLVRRYLHTRPKGGAGATTRGWYLHKRFFVESGFLRSLNG